MAQTKRGEKWVLFLETSSLSASRRYGDAVETLSFSPSLFRSFSEVLGASFLRGERELRINISADTPESADVFYVFSSPRLSTWDPARPLLKVAFLSSLVPPSSETRLSFLPMPLLPPIYWQSFWHADYLYCRLCHMVYKF